VLVLAGGAEAATPGALLDSNAKAALSSLTQGIFQSTEAPACAPLTDGFVAQDPAGVRSPLLFCADSAPGGAHVVRIVNQRRYAILVTGGPGTSETASHVTGLASQLSQHLTIKRQVALGPGDSVEYTVAPERRRRT
jgi:hypothetical protein